MIVNIRLYPEHSFGFAPYGTLGVLNYNGDGTVDFSVQTEEGTWVHFNGNDDDIDVKGDVLYFYMGGKTEEEREYLSKIKSMKF